MVALRTFGRKLVKQDNGSETIEYAVVAGLIAVLVIGAVHATGLNVVSGWNSISSAIVAADTAGQSSQSGSNSNSNSNNGTGQGNNGNSNNGNNGNGNGNNNNGNNGHGNGH
jgi:Flp pilus assembly pilin Flp